MMKIILLNKIRFYLCIWFGYLCDDMGTAVETESDTEFGSISRMVDLRNFNRHQEIGITLTCPTCGNDTYKVVHNKIFCSTKCKNTYHSEVDDILKKCSA